MELWTWRENNKAIDSLKTLHFLTQIPPHSLDPIESFDVVTRNVIANLYEGLLVQDPETLEPCPGIAEHWEVNKPGQVFTFYLRSNTRFSNGDPILAEDVMYTFKRIPHFEGVDLQVTEIRPRVIRIKLSQIMHNFPDYLATPSFGIISRRNTEKYGFDRGYLVSSGPFCLKKKGKDSHPSVIVLEKNPYYWDSDHVDLDVVVYVPVMDPDERLRLFRTRYTPNGERCYYFLNHAPVLKYGELKDDPELQPMPVFATIVLTPNQRKWPLNDVRVRKALSMAITRQNIVDNILPFLQKADSLVPKGMRGFPEFRDLIREDAQRARDLLREAGFDGGAGFPEITMTIHDHDYMEMLANSLIRDWRRNLGIRVKCLRLSWEEYLQRFEEESYDLLYETWHTEISDPGSFLIPLTTDHPFNSAGYSNHRFDSLLQKSMEILEESFRTQRYLEAEKILLEDMATIPLLFESHFCMVDSNVQGAHLNKAAILPLKYTKLTNI